MSLYPDLLDRTIKRAESGGPEQMDPKSVVRKAYDGMAETYLDWTNDNPSPRAMYLAKLFSVLKDPLQATVLDLGCGPGISTKLLAQRCAHVIANDISPIQIQLGEQERGARKYHVSHE